MWVTRWGYEVSAKPVRRGIYRLKTGGFFLRARVTDRAGKERPVFHVGHDLKTIAEAQRRRDRLVDEARAELRGEPAAMTLWKDFAVSLLEERVDRGSIKSAATVEWWQDALEDYLIPAFGHMRATEVQRAHIDTWVTKTALPWMKRGKLIQRKSKRTGLPIGTPQLVKLSPAWINGLLRIVRNISRAIQKKFDLPKNAFEGIEFLPVGRTYTREEPNALPPDIVARFLDVAREKYPQHFAMILLGLVTGLRPSSLRALRRRGSSADVDWETGLLLVRRSHSRGQAIMDATKTKRDLDILLPPAILEELRRHVEALPKGPMQDSDLLFPGKHGRLRSRTVLDKPFKGILGELGLETRFTPRGLRRTFNDIARGMNIPDVVTRSISGHQTEAMQLHYSTARGAEQRAALEQIRQLTTGKTTGKTEHDR